MTTIGDEYTNLYELEKTLRARRLKNYQTITRREISKDELVKLTKRVESVHESMGRDLEKLMIEKLKIEKDIEWFTKKLKTMDRQRIKENNTKMLDRIQQTDRIIGRSDRYRGFLKTLAKIQSRIDEIDNERARPIVYKLRRSTLI